MNSAWAKFSILYSIQFIQLLDFMSIGPSGAIFVKNGFLKSSSIALSITAYSISAIIGSFILGKFNRFSNYQLLVGLMSIFGLSQLFLVFQINDLSFIALRILGGLSGGLMGAIAYSNLNSIEDGKNIGLWNGRIQTAQSIVTLIGIPFCLFIVSHIDQKWFYIIISLFSFVIILNLKMLKNLNNANNQKKIVFNKKNIDIIFTGFFCYFSAFLFITNLPNFLINVKNISSNELSISYIISGILTIITSGFIGKIVDKKNSKIFLLVSLTLLSFTQWVLVSQENIYSAIYILFPLYLILSTSRMIYQRAIIIEKKNQDIISLHLLNNISIRTGILVSGVIYGAISASGLSIQESFSKTNYISIYSTIFTIIFLILSISLERRECSGIQ